MLSADCALEMARLGPFGTPPRVAVAVSGGADSTALALLAAQWAAASGGFILALIVDHGLRTESAAQARLTQTRLAARGIESRIITLAGLAGPGLQARARAARHAALGQAARSAGFLYLAFGHHARDQAETVAMRALRGGGGQEGMASWSARNDIVIIRPLLGMQPAALRDFLLAAGMPWVEDPSNADPNFERARIRATSPQSWADARPRAIEDAAAAMFLARHAAIRPEGFAVLDSHAAPPAALAALIRTLGGAQYKPAARRVAALAACLRPATLGGVRIVPAGRFGPGWLLAREPAACAAAVPATSNAVWDRRFRLPAGQPDATFATTFATTFGTTFGALGADAARHRNWRDVPALVLRTMPCLRLGDEIRLCETIMFAPLMPAASHPFLA